MAAFNIETRGVGGGLRNQNLGFTSGMHVLRMVNPRLDVTVSVVTASSCTEMIVTTAKARGRRQTQINMKLDHLAISKYSKADKLRTGLLASALMLLPCMSLEGMKWGLPKGADE